MFLIPCFQSISGLPSQQIDRIDINSLIAVRLSDYACLPDRFPVITLGAALGGASAHLSLALGGPFLPLAFVVTLRGGATDGDVQAYFQRSAGLALQIAEDNPGILTIQHFDPVHDGWVIRFANHLRFKLLELPRVYREFINRHLEPGGSIVYLDCGTNWPRFRVGDRSVFQVGGWGGIPAEEYLAGSERLSSFAASSGLTHSDWRLPGYPLEWGPESEWGCEAAFGEALEAFCRQEGYRFVRVAYPDPQDFSRLAFHASWQALLKAGQGPAGVLIESFTQFDATAAQAGGLLPLWLVFNTQKDLAYLKEMIPLFPRGRPVFFSPLATFSLTPDLVAWQEWEAALGGLEWQNIGARSSHYPGDALALVTWSAPLRRWVADHSRPELRRLSAEVLFEVSNKTGADNGN